MSDCRLQLATHALDQLKTTLKIAESLSNGLVHVPYLGAIAGATIEIINVAQEVTKNKKDAVELAKSVAERTTSLVGALAGKSKTDIPLQVHEEIRKYTDKLEVVRKTLCRHTGTKCWRRVLDRVSNRDEITDCKDMLNESFQVLQVALSINLFNLYANLPKVISQIKSCFEAHKLAQSKLTVIRREELDLREPWKSNGNTVTSVVLAEYNARAVVIKRYGADRTRWAADIDSFLRPDAWQPHFLQLIGQSDENARGLYLVFQHPGVPVENYIQRECRSGVKKCVSEVLAMVIQFSSAASDLLRKDRGGCKLDTAQVCLRPTNTNPLLGSAVNFVLVDFDPSHFFNPNADEHQMIEEGWDVFVRLITRAITGSVFKPNYVLGQHGPTGPIATRIFRFLIHFLIDFRYHQDRHYDDLSETFAKLTAEMKALQDEVESMAVRQGTVQRNPLLESLRPHDSELCAIWDFWRVLPIEPGDLGFMVPADDPKCPQFHKITNVAENIHQWAKARGNLLVPKITSYPEFAEHQYIPSDNSCWDSEVLDDSTIRHRLRLGKASGECLKFVFSRARKIALLGDAWEYDGAWSNLRHIHENGELGEMAMTHNVAQEDLMLIFSSSQSEGYTHLIFKTRARRDALLAEVGTADGDLYYFENRNAREGELFGYWSASGIPGLPLWGAFPTAEGPEWGWMHSDEDFKVEVGRKGPVQHIRYVSL